MTIQSSLLDDVEPEEIKPTQIAWSHKELVSIAARWLNSKCGVVLPEFVTYEAEIADVLGFSRRNSYMIEVKVSRADFLRDKKKYFRYYEEMGVGNLRYYACTRGLIGPLEVPDGWGLIYVSPNGNARQMLAPDRKKANYEAEKNILYSYARRAVVKGHHASIIRSMNQDKAILLGLKSGSTESTQ